MRILTLLIQIVLMARFVLSQPESCSGFSDCFNCTVSERIDCMWNDGKCEPNTKGVPTTYDDFYSTCLKDPAGLQIINHYCGEEKITLEDSKTAHLAMPKINNLYGLVNLVCKYTYDNGKGKKNIDLNISSEGFEQILLDNLRIFIEAIFPNGSTGGRKLTSSSSKIQVKGPKTVSLVVFLKESTPYLPFEMTLTVTKQGVSITMISTIILICVAFIICAVSIYLFAKRLKRQRMIEREYRMRIEILGVNQGVNNVNLMQTQELILTQRKKQIEEILKTELSPKKYNEDIGKYNINCSICLEDYNHESLIVVTKCSHVFHFECMKKLLNENLIEPRCPNCNNHLLPEIKFPQNNEQVSRFHSSQESNPHSVVNPQPPQGNSNQNQNVVNPQPVELQDRNGRNNTHQNTGR